MKDSEATETPEANQEEDTTDAPPAPKKGFGGLFGKTMNQIRNVIDDLSE